MKKLFNWSLVLGAFVAAFYLIGLIVPRNLTQGCKVNFASKTTDVYALFADVATWPQWHPAVSRVEESPKRNGHPLWNITDKEGESYDLEVVQADGEHSFGAVYERDGSRYTLRVDIAWCGEGSRVHVTQAVDTRDTWQRAEHFLLPSSDVSPLALLNAVAAHLGEKAKPDND